MALALGGAALAALALARSVDRRGRGGMMRAPHPGMLPHHHQAALWLDHHEARIFQVHPEAFDETAVQAPRAHIHRHEKGAAEERHHPDDQRHFFHEVAEGLAGADQILVVGPSTAKLQFLRYLHEHERALEPKVVGIETVDHPTDAQLVAYMKRYFMIRDTTVH